MWHNRTVVVVMMAEVTFGFLATAVVHWIGVRFLGERSVVVLIAISNRVDNRMQNWNVYMRYEVQVDHVVLLLGLALARSKFRWYEVTG